MKILLTKILFFTSLILLGQENKTIRLLTYEYQKFIIDRDTNEVITESPALAELVAYEIKMDENSNFKIEFFNVNDTPIVKDNYKVFEIVKADEKGYAFTVLYKEKFQYFFEISIPENAIKIIYPLSNFDEKNLVIERRLIME